MSAVLGVVLWLEMPGTRSEVSSNTGHSRRPNMLADLVTV